MFFLMFYVQVSLLPVFHCTYKCYVQVTLLSGSFVLSLDISFLEVEFFGIILSL